MVRVAAFALLLLLTGCSLEGKTVGGCVLHEARSFYSGIVWADCPLTEDALIQGGSQGYAQAFAPAVNGAFIGTGAAVAGLLISNGYPSAVRIVP